MIEQFFKTLSYIFHPMLMPILAIYAMFELPTIPASLKVYDALFFFPDEAKFRLYIVLGVLTFVAPLLSVLIMYWNGMISSLHMENRRERVYPFFITTFYFLLAYIFVSYQLPEDFRHSGLLGFLFGLLVVNLICFLLNYFIKISIHAVASFGAAAALLAYNQNQIAYFENERFPNLGFTLFLLVIAGLVVTGRLYLKAHTLKEVLLGMVVGFFGIYLCVKFGIYL